MISTRQHSSFRHEAFLYRDEDDFLDGMVPFLREGVALGQPVVVAIRATKMRPLRDALESDQSEVLFVDMTKVGHNPARIIPNLRLFLDRHCAGGQPVRGVSEPIWPGRRPTEVREAQLHEALINVAVDPDTPAWLRCPYDVGALTEAELAEAARSHPILVESGDLRGSRSYGGMQHVEDLFAGDLPEPGPSTDGIALPASATVVGTLVNEHSAAAGLDAEKAWALALAVREVTGYAVPGCTLRVWCEPAALICEIRDPEPVEDPMAGRVRPLDSEPDVRSLWLANQICDLVQVRSTPEGSTIRIVTWL